MKNRCLIFGGGGFIGSHLTEALVKNKYPVTVFSRKSDNSSKNLSDVINDIQFIEGDFNNIDSVIKIIDSGDIVFDLIASSLPFSSSQSPIEEINHHIFSHVRLIQACCKKKVKKIIFASSGGGVYGNKKKLPISEIELLEPISPHAIGKIAIEYYLSYYSKMYGVSYIIYRLSNPYGPRQIAEKGFGIVPTLFDHALKNTPPTLFDHGNLVRDFIFIDDLIEAITQSFDKKNKFNLYNIGSGRGTAIKDLWKMIKKISGSNIKPRYKPKRPFDIQSIVLDTKRFEKEFNCKPRISLMQGLQKEFNWAKENFV
ncbi:MAG: NAD-dependent epimerase/dehydratase family protein [Patescibacteria group bacterium]